MKALMIAAAVAIGLAFLLLWRSPLITKGVYRMGFLLGLAAFAGILFSPGGEWDFRMGRGPSAFLALIPITLLAIVPFLLLVESGIAGYRGFSTWMRHVSLALAILGGVGLLAAILLPIVLGWRAR